MGQIELDGVVDPACTAEVSCGHGPAGTIVASAGIGEAWISQDGREIRVELSGQAGSEALLNAGLVLALARQRVFCLHASAVLAPVGALAFCGPPGAGKSTLAARLADEHGLSRLSDDLLPVEILEGVPHALPHFPQPKLRLADQYPAESPPRVRLAALFVLAPIGLEGELTERGLAPSDRVARLFHLVVGTRLLPVASLADVLDFSVALAASVPIIELRYPHRPGSVSDVAALVDRLPSPVPAPR